MAAIVVLVTVPNRKEARKIARTLVHEKRVACVNIVPAIESVYRWQGKIESGGELLLIMKTFSLKFKALSKRIQELHPYTVPEILALPVQAVNGVYLKWMKESLKK